MSQRSIALAWTNYAVNSFTAITCAFTHSLPSVYQSCMARFGHPGNLPAAMREEAAFNNNSGFCVIERFRGATSNREVSMRCRVVISLFLAWGSVCNAQLGSSNLAASASTRSMFVRAQSASAKDQFSLADAYLSGRGINQDYSQALSWFKKAADHGHAGAQTELGRMYAEGLGISKDYAQALMWFRRAASEGYAPAQTNLGLMYLEGLGMRADSEAAVNWLEKAAAGGSHQAESNLGFVYLSGLGVNRPDAARAVRLFRKAAAAEIVEAEFNLGFCYEIGQGVSQDLYEAARFYSMAAKKSYAPARNNLGAMYLNGRGVARDVNQALSLFLAAAEAENSKAFLNLAQTYYSGNGVPPDEAVAYMWLELARSRGESVDDSLGTVASRLTASEIAKAMQQADGWGAQHARVVSASLGHSFERGQ
jgi:TPR repeat protein